MVVAVRSGRREAPSLVVTRRLPHEPLGAGVRERAHGVVEPELRERTRFALAGAEAGAPEQPLGLLWTETSRDRRARSVGYPTLSDATMPRSRWPGTEHQSA